VYAALSAKVYHGEQQITELGFKRVVTLVKHWRTASS
jgi:hypothetical protein